MLTRQIKAGRKIGLAWDVFLTVVSAKVQGLTDYHSGVVPFTREQMAHINNKVTMALKGAPKTSSPHQIQCARPIGLGGPDLTLSAGQVRVQLALKVLHSDDQEGQVLRACLGTVQRYSRERRFPWASVFTCPAGTTRGFVEAVSDTLQLASLCIRTVSDLFPEPAGGDATGGGSYELGLSIDTPIAARTAIAQHLNVKGSDKSLASLAWHRASLTARGYGQHLLTTPRPGMTAITRTPLWESIEVDATRNDLPEYTAVSDGTGNGVIGTCQLADDMLKAIGKKKVAMQDGSPGMPETVDGRELMEV